MLKMCRFLCRTASMKPSFRDFTTTQILSKYVEEPDYIKFTKPQVPVYDLLNIQLKSYDYTVLEHYAKYVHKIALNMDFDVTDAWATPHQAWKVTNMESGTNKVAQEYLLNAYERNVQISDLPAYCAPLFFEVIQSALPMGVSVSVHPHELHHSEIRYIPDYELLALKDQLDVISNSDVKS